MIHPVLLTVWGVLAACFMGLLVYRGQITRYEDERLYLHHDDTPQEMQQSMLVRRVKQLQPVLNLIGASAGLVTATVISLYVWNCWQTR